MDLHTPPRRVEVVSRVLIIEKARGTDGTGESDGDDSDGQGTPQGDDGVRSTPP